MSDWSYSAFHAAQREQWRDEVANLTVDVERLEQLVAERDHRIVELEHDVRRLSDELMYGRRV